jgi:uncharacterized protein
MLVQQITSPFGVTVFGSAIVRTMPDVAVIYLSVSEVKPHPKEAFQAVRKTAQHVQAFLSTAQVKESGSSKVSLTEEYRFQNNENKLIGYRTSVQFQVTISDLNRLEDILTGVVDAGANKIISINYQSARLKEIRAEARTQAFAAAQEKAEVYCKAAGVELGEVIHIEDVNPDQLRGNEGLHARAALAYAEAAEAQAFDPASIVISGAVLAAFKFRER